jgi:hypothetical protein
VLSRSSRPNDLDVNADLFDEDLDGVAADLDAQSDLLRTHCRLPELLRTLAFWPPDNWFPARTAMTLETCQTPWSASTR